MVKISFIPKLWGVLFIPAVTVSHCNSLAMACVCVCAHVELYCTLIQYVLHICGLLSLPIVNICPLISYCCILECVFMCVSLYLLFLHACMHLLFVCLKCFNDDVWTLYRICFHYCCIKQWLIVQINIQCNWKCILLSVIVSISSYV